MLYVEFFAVGLQPLSLHVKRTAGVSLVQMTRCQGTEIAWFKFNI